MSRVTALLSKLDRIQPADPGFPRPDVRAQNPADPDEMTSVAKALGVLDSFRGRSESLGVTEVAAANGLPKSTAFRLLAHLEASGLLERDGRKYRPSWQVFELAQSSVLGRLDGPRSQALPLMTDLHALTRGVVHFGVRRGTEVMIAEKIFGTGSVDVPTYTGARLPLTTTSLGKALLVGELRATGRMSLPPRPSRSTRHSVVAPGLLRDRIERAAARGFAVDREETVLGVSCVGVPVLRGTRPVGALSVATRSIDFDEQRLARLIAHHAGVLSAALAADSDPPADRRAGSE